MKTFSADLIPAKSVWDTFRESVMSGFFTLLECLDIYGALARATQVEVHEGFAAAFDDVVYSDA